MEGYSKDFPADLTMPDGTTHRLWLSDNCRVLGVENNTISVEQAEAEMKRIWAENQIDEE